MIRAHLVLSVLSPGLRRAAEVFCAALALAGIGLVTAYFGRSALRNWVEGTVSAGIIEVPQWIPETVLLLGLVLLCLQLTTYIARLAFDPDAAIFASDATSE
jgi:TRAP-type C4-dicarboxylate transport system permease small subunit